MRWCVFFIVIPSLSITIVVMHEVSEFDYLFVYGSRSDGVGVLYCTVLCDAMLCCVVYVSS